MMLLNSHVASIIYFISINLTFILQFYSYSSSTSFAKQIYFIHVHFRSFYVEAHSSNIV